MKRLAFLFLTLVALPSCAHFSERKMTEEVSLEVTAKDLDTPASPLGLVARVTLKIER